VQGDLEAVQDFDNLRRLHSSFVAQLRVRCFLEDAMGEVQKEIYQVSRVELERDMGLSSTHPSMRDVDCLPIIKERDFSPLAGYHLQYVPGEN